MVSPEREQLERIKFPRHDGFVVGTLCDETHCNNWKNNTLTNLK